MNDHNYSVGDRVHFGFNGDYSPGVVSRVTATSVWVQRADLDTSAVPQAQRVYGRSWSDQTQGVVFVPPTADAEHMHFKVSRARATRGMVLHGGYSRLFPGALLAWNPHI